MLGSFLSKHGIKLAVVLLIVGAVYNYTSVKVFVPEGYLVYNVDNNSILYNGEVKETFLQQLGKYLQEIGLFGKATKSTFIIDQASKKNESTVALSIPVDPMKLNEGFKRAIALIGLDIKNKFLSNKVINFCIVEYQNFNPIECLKENDLIALVGKTEQKEQQQENETKNENENSQSEDNKNETSSNQILERWVVGAEKISQAQHFLTINKNDIWRIYFTEEYSEAASSISASIFENKLVSTEYFDYFALFAAKDNKFYNGDVVYHFAIPFNQKELKNGEAESKAANFYRVLKAGYMHDYKLIIAICDYDFNMVKVYTE